MGGGKEGGGGREEGRGWEGMRWDGMECGQAKEQLAPIRRLSALRMSRMSCHGWRLACPGWHVVTDLR